VSGQEANRAPQAKAAAPAAPAHPKPSPVPTRSQSRDRRTLLLGAAVSLAAFVLYVLTAARDVIAGDTAEFLVTAKTLGVAHAPGYPLLSMLGHVFSWLPVGATAFRIGLLAVVCSTATVALVFATVWRLTSLRAPAAAAGLALAFTPVFWRWSLQIETFPLNNLLVALVVYLLVRWHQDPVQRKFLIGAAFAFGLGLTNQQTIVLLAPAIAWLLWLHRQQLNRERRTIAYAAVAVVAGLVPYAYVPLAAMGHSPNNWDYVHSFPAFMRLILRTDYGGLISQGSGAPTGRNAVVRTWFMLRGLGIVVGIFALLGIVIAYRKLRWYFWFVVLAFACSGVAFMFATNIDPTNGIGLFVLERFFLLPLVIVAPLVGLGVTWVSRVIVARTKAPASLRTLSVTALLVVTASLVVVGLNYSTINVSHDHVTGNYARAVLDELKPHTILFANGDESDEPALYVLAAARHRPDVTVLLAPLIGDPWYASVLRHNHEIIVPSHLTTLAIIRANPDRPVAFTGGPPDNSLSGKYYLYPDGLVSDLERVGHPIAVGRDESDNKAQLSRIVVPNYKSIKPDSIEPVILDHYANIPYRIGQAYQLAGQKAEAITWYRRAEAMDPSLPLAAQAIRKLGGDPRQ
jgi:4-amino-4-deoxy-L-arabinose transferase-like glycosyltransferase